MPNTQKAYKDLDFLNSPSARTVRILCEYEEPRERFRRNNLRDTIVIFGSARIKSPEEAAEALAAARAAEDAAALEKATRAQGLARYYADTRKLARRLTEWSLARPEHHRDMVITTGGGPGIMEAGNRGASDVPGGRSVGLGISLPFEEKVNRWVTPELALEFHYFFMRKYWFSYLAKAMVVMPGGFGTLDEFMEVVTLVQTLKIKKRLPIVLYGTEYWDKVLHMEPMVEFGTISPEDLNLFHRTDSVEDAYQYLVEELETHHLKRKDDGEFLAD